MGLNHDEEQNKINQAAIHGLRSIAQAAVALQQDVGDFSAHDLEAISEADQLLTEILDHYETQEGPL